MSASSNCMCTEYKYHGNSLLHFSLCDSPSADAIRLISAATELIFVDPQSYFSEDEELPSSLKFEGVSQIPSSLFINENTSHLTPSDTSVTVSCKIFSLHLPQSDSVSVGECLRQILLACLSISTGSCTNQTSVNQSPFNNWDVEQQQTLLEVFDSLWAKVCQTK